MRRSSALLPMCGTLEARRDPPTLLFNDAAAGAPCVPGGAWVPCVPFAPCDPPPRVGFVPAGWCVPSGWFRSPVAGGVAAIALMLEDTVLDDALVLSPGTREPSGAVAPPRRPLLQLLTVGWSGARCSAEACARVDVPRDDDRLSMDACTQGASMTSMSSISSTSSNRTSRTCEFKG